MNNSLKSKVKIWVSFLKLCHQSDDSEIQSNLKKSEVFYKDWGNYQTGSFDIWWKEYSHLFRERQSVTRLNEGDLVDGSSFTISFPMIYSPTTATKIFKDRYSKAFEEQRVDKKKVKKVYGGSFELKPDDFQVSQFEYYLKFCKEVYLPLVTNNSKPKLKDLVVAAKEKFKEKTKKTSSRRIPFTNSTSTYEVLRRLATRYKTYSHNLMINASKGEFPGEYEEKSIKNQVDRRKRDYPVRKFSKGVPRSKHENYKHRESGYDMYATRKRDLK
jgi:hypothetical protein